MATGGWRARLRYRFDTFMSGGSGSLFLSLAVLFVGTLLLLGAIRLVLYAVAPEGTGEIEGRLAQLWTVFLELTDPGSMGEDTGSSALFKAMAVLSGVAGVAIFSGVIAFLTTALDQKIADLRKGRSKVLESGHTLILGWNERVVEVLRELVEANESETNPCVVVLADREKEEMDDHLALHLANRKNTRVVTRSGNPSSLASLEKVSAGEAKSIIVLASCAESGSPEEKAASDARVVKTALAVLAGRPEGRRFNIVAEVFEERMRRIVESLSPEEVTTIDSRDILAKILVQTSRSSGLAVVYTEILGFAGNEMYFASGPWAGLPFGEVQFRFPDGVPLGRRRPDGSLQINPPPATLLEPADELLILTSDNSAIAFQPAPVAAPRPLPLRPGRAERRVEHCLVLGWNAKAPAIVRQYGDYVSPGSVVTVLCLEPTEEIQAAVRDLQAALPKIRIQLADRDPLQPETLAEAKPFAYHNVVILSQGGGDDPEKVDSETIVILLLLRALAARTPGAGASTRLITEVMDSENQELVSRAGVNDFIISNRLVSKLFAQVSEQRRIKQVYDDLFQAEGSEIYVKPAGLYLEQFPMEVTFADLMGLAQRRGEVCLGVKVGASAGDAARNYGITLNPDKNTRYLLQPQDGLVVVAEDDL